MYLFKGDYCLPQRLLANENYFELIFNAGEAQYSLTRREGGLEEV